MMLKKKFQDDDLVIPNQRFLEEMPSVPHQYLFMELDKAEQREAAQSIKAIASIEPPSLPPVASGTLAMQKRYEQTLKDQMARMQEEKTPDSMLASQPAVVQVAKDWKNSPLTNIQDYKTRDLFASAASRLDVTVQEVKSAAAQEQYMPHQSGLLTRADVAHLFDSTKPQAPLTHKPPTISLSDPLVACDHITGGMSKVWLENREREHALERLKSHAAQQTAAFEKDLARFDEEIVRRQESNLYVRQQQLGIREKNSEVLPVTKHLIYSTLKLPTTDGKPPASTYAELAASEPLTGKAEGYSADPYGDSPTVWSVTPVEVADANAPSRPASSKSRPGSSRPGSRRGSAKSEKAAPAPKKAKGKSAKGKKAAVSAAILAEARTRLAALSFEERDRLLTDLPPKQGGKKKKKAAEAAEPPLSAHKGPTPLGPLLQKSPVEKLREASKGYLPGSSSASLSPYYDPQAVASDGSSSTRSPLVLPPIGESQDSGSPRDPSQGVSFSPVVDSRKDLAWSHKSIPRLLSGNPRAAKNEDLQRVEYLKQRMTFVDVQDHQIPRAVLEKALVRPHIDLVPEIATTMLPTPFFGLPPNPLVQPKKAKTKGTKGSKGKKKKSKKT